MERNWFRDSFAAWTTEDDRERQARKRRKSRILLVSAVIVVPLALLLVHANARGLGIAYWQSLAQPCGTLRVASGLGIKVGAGPSTATDAQAASTCFEQAYAHCQAATLTETFAFFDSASTYTYLIEPPLFAQASAGHSCSLAVQQEVLPGPRGNGWQACADLAQRWYGVHFYGCSTYGDLFVSVAPLSQSPAGVACGDIQVHVRPFIRSVLPTTSLPTSVDNTAPTVVACFAHAQQTCQPAWAAATVTFPADPSGVLPLVQRQLLLVEPYRRTCQVLELHWSTYTTYTTLTLYEPPSVCSEPSRDAHGLLVAHCASGDIQIVLPTCGPDGMVTVWRSYQAPTKVMTPCASVPPASQ